MSSDKITILTDTEFLGVRGSKTALTNRGNIEFELLINAGGAYSDRIAHSFGIGLDYKLIPFKGIYKKLKGDIAHTINGNIYPVPDIRNPFLGVHFTRSINGDVYVGPTAIPAFGRENYGIVKGMDFEAIDILRREAVLFFVNTKFRNLALLEPRKYLPTFFFNDAEKLVKSLKPEDLESSGKVGIRPQLIDWKNKDLIMDFKVLRDGDCIHILNAISPAFTSSLDFAKLVVEEYIEKS